MAATVIKHILFDLGGTLMHARGDWAPVHTRADQALVDKLRACDLQISASQFRQRLHEYYQQRDKDLQETTYHFVLRELLKELSTVEVSEADIRSALDAMYAITQTNWQIESDTANMLRDLKANAYRAGIFSNAGDDKDVQELIEGFGVRSYFDFVLTSAACFYRKPHSRAFEIALAQWNINPEEAVMVGDSLEADIFGAKRLGMKTIWITRRATFKDEDMRRIQPDFSIRKLTELLPTLERMSIGHI